MNHQDLSNPVMSVFVQGLRYMDREIRGIYGLLHWQLILLISYFLFSFLPLVRYTEVTFTLLAMY